MKTHGHVTPNADGSVARCGGRRLCKVCQQELADLNSRRDVRYFGITNHGRQTLPGVETDEQARRWLNSASPFSKRLRVVKETREEILP